MNPIFKIVIPKLFICSYYAVSPQHVIDNDQSEWTLPSAMPGNTPLRCWLMELSRGFQEKYLNG